MRRIELWLVSSSNDNGYPVATLVPGSIYPTRVFFGLHHVPGTFLVPPYTLVLPVSTLYTAFSESILYPGILRVQCAKCSFWEDHFINCIFVFLHAHMNLQVRLRRRRRVSYFPKISWRWKKWPSWFFLSTRAIP